MKTMTSRERLATTLCHRQPDRVCVDFGATFVTGIHVSVIHRLRQRVLGEMDYRVKVIEPYQMLGEIDDALRRIVNKTYGICEGTGKPIKKARLEAKPWARYCVEYARMLEQGLVSEFQLPDREEEELSQ